MDSVGASGSWTAEDGEVLRQARVYASGILGRRAHPECRSVVERTAARFGAPISMISILDGDRQWFPARVGLTLDEAPRENAFCECADAWGEEALYVTDATLDPRFAGNPFVTGAPHVRFYAAIPLVVASGEALGTLCIIDTRPRPALEAADHADFLALAAEALAAIEQLQTRLEYGAEAIARLVGQIRTAAEAGKDRLVTELDRILREVETTMPRGR
jgi:GAF domain-containing protein